MDAEARAAAAAAYERYGPALRRKCRRMLGDSPDTEDIVQGLFVDMLRQGRLELELPYLYRAVTNRCLNRLRADATHRRLLAEHGSAAAAPTPRTLCDERVITTDLLAKLYEHLDEKHAEVLAYHYVDDMTQEEIAELLNTSRRTVGKRIKRIREMVDKLRSAHGDVS
ncbi:MAG: sigma-70 family RNA polymerase sigma factor [Myxococcales bacterium]|nr:sigma-70 family RNA polymerase sigma factor [Myxococcales bacterium]